MDKKGRDVVSLDVTGLTLVTDYFVLATGTSVTHVATLADEVEERLTASGVSLMHREGRRDAHWVLLDFSDVVVHIFTEEERAYYNLERLLGDAHVETFSG